VIAFSCGIEISAVHCLDLSQSTRVTDRQTDKQTDRQNDDSRDRASTAPCGKKSQKGLAEYFLSLKVYTSLIKIFAQKHEKLSVM